MHIFFEFTLYIFKALKKCLILSEFLAYQVTKKKSNEVLRLTIILPYFYSLNYGVLIKSPLRAILATFGKRFMKC